MTQKLVVAAAAVSLLSLFGTLEAAVGDPLTANDISDIPELFRSDPRFFHAQPSPDADQPRDAVLDNPAPPQREGGSDPLLSSALSDASLSNPFSPTPARLAVPADAADGESTPSLTLHNLAFADDACCGASAPDDDLPKRGGLLSGGTLAVLGAGLVALGVGAGARPKHRHRRSRRRTP